MLVKNSAQCGISSLPVHSIDRSKSKAASPLTLTVSAKPTLSSFEKLPSHLLNLTGSFLVMHEVINLMRCCCSFNKQFVGDAIWKKWVNFFHPLRYNQHHYRVINAFHNFYFASKALACLEKAINYKHTAKETLSYNVLVKVVIQNRHLLEKNLPNFAHEGLFVCVNAILRDETPKAIRSEALLFAVKRNHLKVVQLLKKGQLIEESREVALLVAIRREHLQIVQELISDCNLSYVDREKLLTLNVSREINKLILKSGPISKFFQTKALLGQVHCAHKDDEMLTLFKSASVVENSYNESDFLFNYLHLMSKAHRVLSTAEPQLQIPQGCCVIL